MEKGITQLLNKNDPIGFAESILTKQKTLKYKRLTDIVLLEFDAKKIRNAINNSDIVIKAIIKYSLARIFLLRKLLVKVITYLKKNLFKKIGNF